MATKKKAKKKAAIKYKKRIRESGRWVANKVKRTGSTGARIIKEAIK